MNANVGMLNPVAALCAYTPGSAPTYTSGTRVAEAISASLAWNRSDSHFYGDDMELDSENGVLGYTLTFEPSGLKDDIRALILGENVSSSEYTITEDASPDVGFGFVRVMRTSGNSGVSTTYEGWWFYKLKFSLTTEEARTKEDSIEWRTPTLTGAGAGVQQTTGGKLEFAVHKSFDTKAAAIAYINGKAGITSTSTT